MLVFSGAVVALGEMETGIVKCLIVTPLGKKGYLFSRIGLPAVIAGLYDLFIVTFFSLTEIPFLETVILSFFSVIMAIVVCMFILAFARNRLEGMVFIKLCGFFVTGIPVPFFVHSDLKYLAGIFPSFWITQYAMNNSMINLLAALIVSGIWIILLSVKYDKKLI